MLRLPMFCGLGILFLALLVSSGASQDAKKDKDDGKKDKVIKGSVPAGWKALKLTKEQTKKVQTIDAEYKTKIAELTAKIDDLKQQSKIEMAKQLTDDQKATLAKLAGLDTKDAPKDKASDKKEPTKDK
jgi:hypothetical protein